MYDMNGGLECLNITGFLDGTSNKEDGCGTAKYKLLSYLLDGRRDLLGCGKHLKLLKVGKESPFWQAPPHVHVIGLATDVPTIELTRHYQFCLIVPSGVTIHM